MIVRLLIVDFGPTLGLDGLQTRDRCLQIALQHVREGLRAFLPSVTRRRDANVGQNIFPAHVIGRKVMRSSRELCGRVPFGLGGWKVDFFCQSGLPEQSCGQQCSLVRNMCV